MLFVLPTTSTIRPASYLAPQSYEYYPSQGYYRHHDAPRFAAPSYPSQLDFFRQPSAEELQEREYRRALEVISNHRRRQAEKEAAIHRHQLAEAARQRYFAALAAELEQQRREELIAARRAEFIRSQQARARLVAGERQHALGAFLRQLNGAQPVCQIRGTLSVCSILISSSSQVTHQPHVVKHKPVDDALKQRLASESDADITDTIQSILSSLDPRPTHSEEPKDSDEDPAKLIQNLICSIFPGLVSRAQPQPTPSTEQAQPSVSEKGKGKARAVHFEEPQESASKPESTGEPFADILRHIMELSKGTLAPRSADEAGPSGSSHSSPSTAQPTVTEREQAHIDRAIALSSVEHVQDTLTKLQTGFVLPAELDHYTPSTDDRDETASVSSVSSSDLTKLIPYTTTNKPVYKYENELNGLLEELDRIDSHGDAEVREKRKQVVKAIEKALGGVEHLVGEAVEKRLSLIPTTTLATEEPVEGFDIDEDVTEEVSFAPEQVETPVVVDEVTIPEPPTSDPVVETVATAAESSLVDEALPEFNTPAVPEPIVDVPTESDVEASTATITPASVESPSVTEPAPTQSQVQVDAPENVDTFLLREQVSPPSPAKKPQEIDTDADEEVLVFDSDTEKSDWSELEEHLTLDTKVGF